MRFLTVELDKYGVKYNEDKRQGLIGKVKKKKDEKKDRDGDRDRGRSKGKGGGDRDRNKGRKPAAKADGSEEE